MRDQIQTTNPNWMDENYRNKNDQKLDGNFTFGQQEGEFLRNQDYYSRDNMQMFSHQHYYPNYEYHHPQYFYDNIFAHQKEPIPTYPETFYDQTEMMPFMNSQSDIRKMYKPPDIQLGMWTSNMIPGAENIQAMLMAQDYLHSRPPQHFPHKQRQIKQQQSYFLRNENEPYSNYRSRGQPVQYPNIYEIHHSKSEQKSQQPHVKQENKGIGGITAQQRKSKIKLYRQKRQRRTYTKKVAYDCRKKVADQRIRIKGRFVTKEQALSMLQIGQCDQISHDHIKKLLTHQMKNQKQSKNSPIVKLQ